MLDTYRIIVAAFLVIDKANQVRFFKKTFLVANFSPEVVLGMSFFTFSSINIDFWRQKLWWRTYIIYKVFLTINHIKLVEKKEFAALALNSEYEIFIVYVVLLNSIPLIDTEVHLSYRPQLAVLIIKRLFQCSRP